MIRRVKTIYELFGDYTEEEVNLVINQLSYEDRLIVKSRYGNDLHNPQTWDNWDRDKSFIFYREILRKIEKCLVNNRQNMKNNINVSETYDFSLTDDMQRLLDLLGSKKNISGSEIIDKMGIDNRTFVSLLRQLKIMGVNVNKKYYSNGSIKYNSVNW